MKRWLSFLLTLTLLFALVPGTALAAETSGQCGNSARWAYDDGVLTISGSGKMADYRLDSDVPWYDYRHNVRQIRLDSGIVRIGNNAFNDFWELSEIVIPDHILEIGDSAFKDADHAQSIKIGDGVTEIESWAFANCSDVTEVTFGKQVKYIGEGAFENCYDLEQVTLPAQLREISEELFCACPNMKQITIPGGVTSVGPAAFMHCAALEDVYYYGTEAQWQSIRIDVYNDELKNANIHFLNEPDPSEPETPQQPSDLLKRSGSFLMFSTDLSDYTGETFVKYHYDYDESWFFNTSSGYQHGLAKMSLAAAMAGMAKSNNDDAWSNAANIRKLMGELKYSDLDIHYPKPQKNSIGYVIGSKTLNGPDGAPCAIVMVAVRSAGYFIEWGGNMIVGAGLHHEGFRLAADQVVSAVEKYIKTRQDAGKLPESVKVWLSGYSRGAATANLAAARLNKTLGKQNVYAYCFECPRNTTDIDADSRAYNNIFNVINPIDLIPKVAMADWGFTRYGKTYEFPFRGSKDWTYLKNRMIREYTRILSENGAENAEKAARTLTEEHSAQEYIFDDFVSRLADGMEERGIYSARYQEALSNFVANKLGSGYKVTVDNLRDCLFMLAGMLPSYLQKSYHTGNVEIDTVIKYTPRSHYPELCMAWLYSLDGETIGGNKTGYRTIFINCPVDVLVYDNDHRLIASIVDEQAKDMDGSAGVFVDSDGQKVVVLPEGQQFTVETVATAKGNVTCTISDYDSDSGRCTHVTTFSDIPVNKKEKLTCSVPEAAGEGALCTLREANGAARKPSVNESGDAVHKRKLRTEAEGSGTASGGGDYLPGEHAKITAAAESGSTFCGWYQNERFISAEPEYRCAVNSDMNLTAVFSGKLFSDVSKESYYSRPVFWAVNHGVTEGNSATTFGPNASCTRAQMVTFLWRAKGSPEPSQKTSVFRDLDPKAYYYKAVLWAVEQGITQGTGKTAFSPHATVTRAQTVTFLWRMENKPKSEISNPFRDVSGGAYYLNAVLWAVKQNITQGVSANSFAPDRPCTRAQIVTFLFRDLA